MRQHAWQAVAYMYYNIYDALRFGGSSIDQETEQAGRTALLLFAANAMIGVTILRNKRKSSGTYHTVRKATCIVQVGEGGWEA